MIGSKAPKSIINPPPLYLHEAVVSSVEQANEEIMTVVFNSECICPMPIILADLSADFLVVRMVLLDRTVSNV